MRTATTAPARRRTRQLLAGGVGAVCLLAVVAACGSGSSGTADVGSGASTSGSGGGGSAGRRPVSGSDAGGALSPESGVGRAGSGSGSAPVPAAPAVPSAIPSSSDAPAASGSDGVVVQGASGRAGVPTQNDPNAQQPAIISTGDVVIRAKDVDVARGQVLDELAAVGGTLADEQTTSDKDGQLTSSRLVLRVPSRTFTSAVNRIGDIGVRVSSVTHSDDVTTQVVDVNSRLSVQRASVARIRLLLNRAQSIRDIVSIESQLSEREATLESLEQQQAYLADQTSLSTITVRLEHITPTKPIQVHPGQVTVAVEGFTGGLNSGYLGLRHFGGKVAIVAGTVLPWFIVLLVLGTPTLLLVRRLVPRRRTDPAPEPAAAP